MLVMIRFAADVVDRQKLEVVVQGCVGSAGSVVGASETSIDVQLTDVPPDEILAELAGLLRGMDMAADTFFDIPSSGQRFGIFDF